MATIHGLSINGGKLDVQLSDSQFSKDSTGLVTLTDAFITAAAAGEVAKVIANAPEDYDTLKEIADYIASDKTGAAQINNAISALQTGKMDKLGVGDGISFLNDVISVMAGQGLGFYGQEVQVKVVSDGGLKLTDDGVSIKLANKSGLNFSQGIRISTGTGIDVNTNGNLHVKVSDLIGEGLIQDDAGKLKVGIAGGLEMIDYGAAIRLSFDSNSALDFNSSGKLTLRLASGFEIIPNPSGKQIGLRLATNHYDINGEQPDNAPFEFNDKGALTIRVGSGVKINETQGKGALSVDASQLAGNGLRSTLGNKLDININNGFQFDNYNALEIKPGNGIYVNNVGVNVRPNDGIAVTEDGVSVKYGTGLAVDPGSNELYVKFGTGLAIDENGYLYVDTAQLAKTSN